MLSIYAIFLSNYLSIYAIYLCYLSIQLSIYLCYLSIYIGISKCVFEETKPPPAGSSADRLEAKKSRAEIIKECRKKCAKTSEQLMIGSPKTKIAKSTTTAVDGQE